HGSTFAGTNFNPAAFEAWLNALPERPDLIEDRRNEPPLELTDFDKWRAEVYNARRRGLEEPKWFPGTGDEARARRLQDELRREREAREAHEEEQAKRRR